MTPLPLSPRSHLRGFGLPGDPQLLFGSAAVGDSDENVDGSGGVSAAGDSTACKMLRILLLAEIVNYTLLRRHLGLDRSATVAEGLVQRCGELFGGARCRAWSDRLVAVEFESATLDDAEAAAAMLQRTFAEPFDLDRDSHAIRLRVGGAAGHDCDEVRLAEGAEKALAEARTEGRDIIRDVGEADLSLDPLELIHELPRALREGEIFLQYQPKVRVRQQEVASAEALVRWRHPTRGLVLPGDFIQAAEQSRGIGALTLWTLEQVLRDQRLLAEARYDIPIFINISAVLLADAGFVEQACLKLGDHGAKIGFEITETAVIRDPESAIRHLQRFADIGVVIAIDDYGAGLSSLAYLKQLPASELKIDKLFVTQLTSSNRDPLIVRSTIDLAHALDMEVTAEGVETPAAMALLSVMGCDMVQGYLVSRPVEIDAFCRFLEEDAHLKAMDGQRFSFLRSDRLWKSA